MSQAGYDYTTVGHVTVDVMADGTRRPVSHLFTVANETPSCCAICSWVIPSTDRKVLTRDPAVVGSRA